MRAPPQFVTTRKEADMRPATLPDTPDRVEDAQLRSEQATAAAFCVLRRAILDGTPVTRRALADEATYTLGLPEPEALRELDVVAQRLGIAALV
jgi:hypothetical protein